MTIVIQVGEPSDLPPVPEGFPRCGSWYPEDDDDTRTEKGRKYGESSPRGKKSRKQPSSD